MTINVARSVTREAGLMYCSRRNIVQFVGARAGLNYASCEHSTPLYYFCALCAHYHQTYESN